MTAEDYAEAGVAPPPEFRGMPLTGVWIDEMPESAPRCEACGDERGECACADF